MKKSALWIVAAPLLVLSIGAETRLEAAEKPSSLAFGTSSIGSSNYVITAGMANILTKKTGISVTAEAVGGSDANVRGLKDRKVDLGMINCDAVANAYLGADQFAKLGRVPVTVLVQGQKRFSYLIARKASGIRTPADLRGKKLIGRRRAMADVEQVANAILKAYGVPKESVKILETAETNEALDALKTGAVDAVVVPGGGRASNLMDLAGSVDVVFVSIAEDRFDVVLRELGPAYHKGSVAGGVYKGQDQPFQAPMQLLAVVARSDLPEDVGYLLTKTLMESPTELAAVHNVGKEWTLEHTLIPPPAPFHPGAVKYFKEKGVWSPALQQAQQRLQTGK